MTIKCEARLYNFEFWGGATFTADELTFEDFETIEGILEDLYPEGIEDTALNDLFWFEEDTIAEWLGYGSFEELKEQRAAE